jgi:hypothetical protein
MRTKAGVKFIKNIKSGSKFVLKDHLKIVNIYSIFMNDANIFEKIRRALNLIGTNSTSVLELKLNINLVQFRRDCAKSMRLGL